MTRDNTSLTILDAIQTWYTHVHSSRTRNGNFQFRDTCQGPHCNDACPEEFILGELTSNSWNHSIKILISLIVVVLALICIIFKAGFVVWLWRLEWLQRDFLYQLGDESYSDIETALEVSTIMQNKIVTISLFLQ